jgi:radical SAM protein with 4Fe4S-binding SPASM domain
MKIVALLSMLHEPPGRPDSATRRFRGEAPLAWALYRLGRSKRIAESAVICWQDQAGAVAPIIDEMKARTLPPLPRCALPHLDGVSAARRWADGWRGGLLETCEFDRGFHGTRTKEILDESQADAVMLIDPSAGLVDPDLIDALIEHAEAHPEVDMCFSQAAPGLSGVLLRKPLVQQLAAGGSHPGTLLVYRPDLPMRDPVTAASCAPVATGLARTLHRFTLDCERQIDRIAGATVHLNGQLISTEAEQLLRLLDATPAAWALPRELVLELTVRRISRPIFSPVSHAKIERADLTLQIAKTVFEEMAAADDARIIFAGTGDPILHPEFSAIVQCAHQAGISAIAVESDLLGLDSQQIERLADLPLDVVSVNLPAISARTYQAIMGMDGLTQAMENLARLIHRRQSQGRGTPLIVPTFVKTAANLAEMEAWYDHWLRCLGCSVIAGPPDFAGQIPDVSLVQMEPPRRRGCARIARRLTVLCDGQVVSCEQDFLARQALGRIGENSIESIWTDGMAALRRDHADGQWQRQALCRACKDWHRP